jgi:hypothetical protein
VISASHGKNLALAWRFAEAARQQVAEAAVLDITSAIAWLSVQGSDFAPCSTAARGDRHPLRRLHLYCASASASIR